MNEVEDLGFSGHLLVDMETVLGNLGAGVEVVDSGPVVLIQLVSSSQQRTRIW